jgi:hypothetical protein
MTPSSISTPLRFCRVFITASSIEERDHARRSSSSKRGSSSEILVDSVFCNLNSAILAARISAGVVAFLGSAGRSE